MVPCKLLDIKYPGNEGSNFCFSNVRSNNCKNDFNVRNEKLDNLRYKIPLFSIERQMNNVT